MTPVHNKNSSLLVRSLYLFSMLFLGLTGFAQMPIFKRYYIADIPGLGWLAQFYTTHFMHYLGAVLLLGLVAYVVVDYFAGSGRRKSLTLSGYFRGFIIAALMASGILLVIRNQSGVHLGDQLIIFLDLFHMGLVMVLIAASVYCLVRKKPWMR